ncbi:extensin-like [Selaginella moellendorffii]|uniref:extensin-like n=1 Tax=Selaginella moellendorffii TaxID=88036 RepID=UPI000D1C3A3D|nr:extensin-like [Selaginella moellendorffii]|eukprot:XP_024520241.1 extensin-like [Selaginella moellendorffii]
MAMLLLLAMLLSPQLLASAGRNLYTAELSSPSSTFLPRLVLGYAICDTCWEMQITSNSISLPSTCLSRSPLFHPCVICADVTAAVECFDAGGRIIFRETSSTDKTGAFRVELPFQIADSVSMLSTCTSRVVRGPLNHLCTYPLAHAYNPFLSLRSLPDGRQVYGVGPFVFRPRAKLPHCSGDRRQQQPQLVSRAVSLQPQTQSSISSPSSSVFQSPSSTATTLSNPSSAWSASNTGSGGLQVNLSLQISTSSSSPSSYINSSSSCPSPSSSPSPGLPTFPFPLFPFPTIPSIPSIPFPYVPTIPFPSAPSPTSIPFPTIPFPTIPPITITPVPIPTTPQAPAAYPAPSKSPSPLSFTPPSPAPYPTPSPAR